MKELINYPVSLENNKEMQSIPLSVEYFFALDPRIVTPSCFENGGMSRICFSNATDNKGNVTIYRSISNYKNGEVGIQDEMHPSNENEGVQLNFTLNNVGKLSGYPIKGDFTLMNRCLGMVLDMVKESGSTIWSDNGYLAVSDGKQWIEKTRANENFIKLDSAKELLTE